MKKQFFFKSLIAIFIVLFASSCSNAYKKVIPADAAFVMEIDLKSIVKKSDVMSRKDDIIKSLDDAKEDEMKEFIEKVMDNESGLNLRKPVYAFINDYDGGDVYILAAVKDKEKLAACIEDLDDDYKITSSDNISYIKIKSDYYEDELIIGAISKNALLINPDASFYNPPKKSVYRDLLKLEKESFFDTEAGKFMKKHSEDVTLALAPNNVPEDIKDIFYDELKEIWDYDLTDLGVKKTFDNLFESHVVTNLEFKSGEVVWNLYCQMNDELEEQQKEIISETISVSDLEQISSKNLVALAAFHMQGQKSIDASKKIINEILKQTNDDEKEMVKAIKKFLGTANGTAILSFAHKDLNKINDGDDVELLCLLPTPKREVKKLSNAINTYIEKTEAKLSDYSDSYYYYDDDYDDDYDGILINRYVFNYLVECKYVFDEYVSILEPGNNTHTLITNNPTYKYGNTKNSFDKASNAKSCYFYAYLNLRPIAKMMENERSYKDVIEFFELLDYAEFKVNELDEASLNLSLTDDSKNALALFVDKIIESIE